MPIGAPQFAVGDGTQPDRLLLDDNLFDLGVFDCRQFGGGKLPGRALAARLLDRERPQQRTDVIGAKRRDITLHGMRSPA